MFISKCYKWQNSLSFTMSFLLLRFLSVWTRQNHEGTWTTFWNLLDEVERPEINEVDLVPISIFSLWIKKDTQSSRKSTKCTYLSTLLVLLEYLVWVNNKNTHGLRSRFIFENNGSFWSRMWLIDLRILETPNISNSII